MNKIGIIGATGNLGRYTVSYLLERGVAPSQIVIVARNPEKAKTFSEKGIEVRYGDYSKDNFDSSILTGIEKLFFNRNVTTAIPVGQARGVVLLAAANKGLPVMEFTPMQIKLSVVGTGSATKEQVIYMVMHLLNIREKIKPDDTADALAAAILTLRLRADGRRADK